MCYNRTRKQDREGAIGMHITDRLLLLLVTVLAEALFTLVRCNFMSFTFFTAWHLLKYFSVYSKPPWPRPQDFDLGSGWRLLT